jgi:hypothetical protein
LSFVMRVFRSTQRSYAIARMGPPCAVRLAPPPQAGTTKKKGPIRIRIEPSPTVQPPCAYASSG